MSYKSDEKIADKLITVFDKLHITKFPDDDGPEVPFGLENLEDLLTILRGDY